MHPVLALFAILQIAELPIAPPAFRAEQVLPSNGKHPIPLAPGRLISIYGQNLGPDRGCVGQADTRIREKPSPLLPNQMFAETLIYPKTLCDVQVFVGDKPAGLLYVQEKQINFKVPQETQVTGTTGLRVVRQGRSSRPVTMRLGLEMAILSLDGSATTRGPVWLKVWMPYGWQQMISYPFDTDLSSFGCHDVEVRRNGALLPSRAVAPLFGQIRSGPMCGSLGLPSAGGARNRLPLHLRYNFDQPGGYEVRYLMRREPWGPNPKSVALSDWTRIDIAPWSQAQRDAWLASRQPPADVAELLTDYLPAILGHPDGPSLKLVKELLFHQDELVRRCAAAGLAFWGPDQAAQCALEGLRSRGPSDVLAQLLRPQTMASHAAEIVQLVIPALRSSSPVAIRGALAVLNNLLLVPTWNLPAAARAQAEATLVTGADSILAATASDLQARINYASILGVVIDPRAKTLLWDFVNRGITPGQSLVAIAWKKNPSDLPKIARYLTTPTDRDPMGSELSSLPNVLRAQYGDTALPYLETALRDSPQVWVRTACARELIYTRRPAGFAFLVDTIEQNRPYKLEMTQFLRDQFPELRGAPESAVLAFVKSRAN